MEGNKTRLKNLSELTEFVGKPIGVSEWIDITQDMINDFAKLTMDEQWIHVDVEKASKYSPFGTTVAHGFMILSFASKMVYDTLEIEDVKMGLNYGLDRVRFPNPILVGSKVRGKVSMGPYEEIDNGLKYKLNVHFELEGQEKPACVAEFLGVAYT